MPKGSRRKKTRKTPDLPAHLVNKSTPQTAAQAEQDAKKFVQENKSKLYSIQKTKRVRKNKEKKLNPRKVHESEKEKKRVSKMSKNIQQKKLRKAPGKGKGEGLEDSGLADPWAGEMAQAGKPLSKPLLKEYKKARNPAVMVPDPGESHNPSQGAYSGLVDKMFDKGTVYFYGSG